MHRLARALAILGAAAVAALAALGIVDVVWTLRDSFSDESWAERQRRLDRDDPLGV